MKIKRFLIAALLVLAFSTMIASAESVGRNQELETAIATNATGVHATSQISTLSDANSTTLDVKYHRVVGYVVMPANTSLGAEYTVGLYDTTSSAYGANEFDEAEAGENEDKKPRWYKYPKRLTNGLSVALGPNAAVVVYFEDTRKF